VVFGDLAEFSQEELTILADKATSVEDFDLAGLKAQIEGIQEGLAKKPAGDELDRAVAQLDDYKSIHTGLTVTTAF
jgi:F-type H+-transporting ATPase subunit epsilon